MADDKKTNDVHELNRAPSAAAMMVKVLRRSIAAIEERLTQERTALAALEALAALPEVPQSFAAPASVGAKIFDDILSEARTRVDSAEAKK